VPSTPPYPTPSCLGCQRHKCRTTLAHAMKRIQDPRMCWAPEPSSPSWRARGPMPRKRCGCSPLAGQPHRHRLATPTTPKRGPATPRVPKQCRVETGITAISSTSLASNAPTLSIMRASWSSRSPSRSASPPSARLALPLHRLAPPFPCSRVTTPAAPCFTRFPAQTPTVRLLQLAYPHFRRALPNCASSCPRRHHQH
jgi:hypothetical protein